MSWWDWVLSFIPKSPKSAEPEALVRARTMLNRGVYGLGSGAKDVDAPTPFDDDGRCDCSGFLAWCFRIPRKRDVDPGPKKDEVWFYTDNLARDSKGQVKGDLGEGVPWDQVQPGDILVYGAGPKTGHCGIVSKKGYVIHCHSGKPPAVTEGRWDFFVKKMNAESVLPLRIRT